MTKILPEQLDSILREGVERGDTPGVVVAVVTSADTLYQGAFGPREVGQPGEMTTDTVGEIMSMTKPLVGVASMQLVEQGRLDLDLPASTYVPWLAEVHVLDGFDVDGQPVLRPPIRPITTRHLLTHTSGFVYPTWNDDALRFEQVSGVPPRDGKNLAPYRVPLGFDPGEQWEYGIGIDWAGWVIESICDCRLGEQLKTAILEPLRMTDTAFVPNESMLQRLASAHRRNDDGSFTAAPRQPIMDRTLDTGGGGLYGTVPDYMRFMRMILTGGELDGVRVMAESTVDLMSQNHIGDLRVSALPPVMPKVSNRAEFFPGVPKTWGLSFQINEEDAPTGRAAGSLSWAGLLNSYFWIDRTNDVAGVYLSQLLPFADTRSIDLFEAVETATYAAL